MKHLGSYPNLRLRRNRKTDWSRRLVSENNISPSDLIWPIFITEGRNKKITIPLMPDVYRHSVDKLGSVVEKAIKLKIPMIALFPHTSDKKKDKIGSEALNENNLICRSLRFIKKNFKSKCIELKNLNLKKLMKIKVNKKQIGSDRLANSISVISKKKKFYYIRFWNCYYI